MNLLNNANIPILLCASSSELRSKQPFTSALVVSLTRRGSLPLLVRHRVTRVLLTQVFFAVSSSRKVESSRRTMFSHKPSKLYKMLLILLLIVIVQLVCAMLLSLDVERNLDDKSPYKEEPFSSRYGRNTQSEELSDVEHLVTITQPKRLLRNMVGDNRSNKQPLPETEHPVGHNTHQTVPNMKLVPNDNVQQNSKVKRNTQKQPSSENLKMYGRNTKQPLSNTGPMDNRDIEEQVPNMKVVHKNSDEPQLPDTEQTVNHNKTQLIPNMKDVRNRNAKKRLPKMEPTMNNNDNKPVSNIKLVICTRMR